VGWATKRIGTASSINCAPDTGGSRRRGNRDVTAPTTSGEGDRVPEEFSSGTESIAADDRQLLDRLRAGDDAAFMQLVDHYGGTMRSVALCHVSSRAVADEVVQDAWLGVLTSLDRFEGRSSLKTWIMSILKHTALNRARKEGRAIPFSSLATEEARHEEPSVPPERFRGSRDRWAGHWVSAPRDFNEHPEHKLLAKEAFESVTRSIASLPPVQRAVITLRDVHGWGSTEVCEQLGITEVNQRVLLHRARSKVRASLEAHFGEVPAPF
jgi:RNA polymerase sigma-70 factor, ECF subfamily